MLTLPPSGPWVHEPRPQELKRWPSTCRITRRSRQIVQPDPWGVTDTRLVDNHGPSYVTDGKYPCMNDKH